MLAKFGWSDLDFNEALTFGFAKTRSRIFGGRFNGQSIFSRREIAEWLEGLRAFTTKLPASVK